MAERNRTLTLSQKEIRTLRTALLQPETPLSLKHVKNQLLHGDMMQMCAMLPKQSVDLVILDPPYNLTKRFGKTSFAKRSMASYTALLSQWIEALLPALKPDASVYICGDWQSSPAIYDAASQYFTLRNRISWEREKGRGAKANWKNCHEDIWFCTVGDDFYFDVDAVKVKRRVLAPYRSADNSPKDWKEDSSGNYRLTHPSNFWNDITIPFWSMRENTDHPTQKPEKLVAKLLLASCKKNGVVLDPFSGSGTTAVVAKKLGRQFIAIEKELEYACIALKRLQHADTYPQIQGYHDGVFWERNSAPPMEKPVKSPKNRKKSAA